MACEGRGSIEVNQVHGDKFWSEVEGYAFADVIGVESNVWSLTVPNFAPALPGVSSRM